MPIWAQARSAAVRALTTAQTSYWGHGNGFLCACSTLRSRSRPQSRIPKDLHRELKLHCVTSDTSVMKFVVEALENKLAREVGRRGRRARAR